MVESDDGSQVQVGSAGDAHSGSQCPSILARTIILTFESMVKDEIIQSVVMNLLVGVRWKSSSISNKQCLIFAVPIIFTPADSKSC
jgi:hypothetical protein